MDYGEFRKQYEEQHPASVPRLEFELNEYPAWAKWATAAAFIAVSTVSAVHTVPTVWSTIEVGEIITPFVRNMASIASLVGVELTILLSAFLMAKGQIIAYIVMVIASIVAIMANLYSSYKNLSDGGDEWAIAVSIVFGVGIPLIALFTGKMAMDIQRANRVQDGKARKMFKEASIAFDKEVERAWKAELKANPSRVSSVQLSNELSNGQSNASPAASLVGHTKVPDASRVVREYLSENPAALNLSPRQLAELLGVGKSTVNNVQREMREVVASNGHMNGNGTHE